MTRVYGQVDLLLVWLGEEFVSYCNDGMHLLQKMNERLEKIETCHPRNLQTASVDLEAQGLPDMLSSKGTARSRF